MPTPNISSSSTQFPTPLAQNTNEPSDNSTTTQSPDFDPEKEFDTFLTLLTAQIRNQDPLTPLDSTQFVEQLATFSNLELQAKNNAILTNIEQLLKIQIEQEPQGAVETP